MQLLTKFLVPARVLEAIKVLLVAMLSPGVPSITEYFTFAFLENGSSGLLKLHRVQ